MQSSSEENRHLHRYVRWCAGTLLFWAIVDCTPAIHAFPLALGIVNTVLFLLVLPAVLIILNCCLLWLNKPELAHMCATPAMMLGTLYALVPGNPFAPDPKLLMTLQIFSLLLLDRAAEAEPMCRRLLQIFESSGSEDAKGSIARTKIQLATAMNQQGKFEEARELLNEVLVTMKEDPDTARNEIAANIADLSITLSKQGDVKQSLKLGHEALKMMESVVSADESDRSNLRLLGCNLTALGFAYMKACQFARAQELYQRSLDIKLKLFGEKYRETVLGQSNLGWSYVCLQDHEKALVHCERAKMTAIELNLQHLDLWSSVLENCGAAHRAVGRLAEAEKELLESLRLKEKRNSTQLDSAWHELAGLYRDKGDATKAEAFYKKALEAREKQYGANHPIVEITLSDLAKLLRSANRIEEAEKLEQRAATIRENISANE